MGDEEIIKKKNDINNNNNVINDPMAVKWTEKYSEQIEYYWNKLPNFTKTFLATLAIFIMGISINGKNFVYERKKKKKKENAS